MPVAASKCVLVCVSGGHLATVPPWVGEICRPGAGMDMGWGGIHSAVCTRCTRTACAMHYVGLHGAEYPPGTECREVCG